MIGDTTTQPKTAPTMPTSFANGNASDILQNSLKDLNQLKSTLAQPRQPYVSREQPGGQPNQQPGGQPYFGDESPEVIEQGINPEDIKASAEVFAAMNEGVIMAGCGIIAKSDKWSEYKAEPDQKRELVRAWERMCESKQLQIPPGVQLLYANVNYALPALLKARNDRQINELRKEQTETKTNVEALQKEVEELKAKGKSN